MADERVLNLVEATEKSRRALRRARRRRVALGMLDIGDIESATAILRGFLSHGRGV